MPKLGETVTEGTIGTWFKEVGDAVAFDDPLFEVSTDKVDSEIPSPYDGMMLEILVGEGETVPVGTVLARIGEPGAAVAEPPATTTGGSGSGPAGNGSTGPSVRLPPRPPRLAPPAGGGRLLSPLVRRLVAENGLDVGDDHRDRRRRPDPARGRRRTRSPAAQDRRTGSAPAAAPRRRPRAPAAPGPPQAPGKDATRATRWCR